MRPPRVGAQRLVTSSPRRAPPRQPQSPCANAGCCTALGKLRNGENNRFHLVKHDPGLLPVDRRAVHLAPRLGLRPEKMAEHQPGHEPGFAVAPRLRQHRQPNPPRFRPPVNIADKPPLTGSNFIRLPTNRPLVIGNDSRKAITRCSRRKPGLSHAGGRRLAAVVSALAADRGRAPGPLRPIVALLIN